MAKYRSFDCGRSATSAQDDKRFEIVSFQFPTVVADPRAIKPRPSKARAGHPSVVFS